MGLSIHYSGRFNPKASLSEMIAEVKDIADLYNWKYAVFNDSFPSDKLNKTTYSQDIYGICFTPPKCETVFLSFLSNGKMSSPLNLQFYGNSPNADYKKYIYMLFVKTQYAGVEIHKLIVHLFKYLSDKYLLDFTVIDEGYYWETGDEKLLENTFKKYTALIENFTDSLEIYPRLVGESMEAYLERIFKQIHSNKKK